jgi:hypothetical protein
MLFCRALIDKRSLNRSHCMLANQGTRMPWWNVGKTELDELSISSRLQFRINTGLLPVLMDQYSKVPKWFQFKK